MRTLRPQGGTPVVKGSPSGQSQLRGHSPVHVTSSETRKSVMMRDL